MDRGSGGGSVRGVVDPTIWLLEGLVVAGYWGPRYA